MASLDTFKTLLNGATAPSDAYITALLGQADALICGYIVQAAVPAGLDDVRAALALALFNRAGAEGESKRIEGEITSVYEAIPESVRIALRRFRTAQAVTLLDLL